MRDGLAQLPTFTLQNPLGFPQSAELEWVRRKEVLYYTIGRWDLGTLELSSLSLSSHPFAIPETIPIPVPSAFRSGLEVVTCTALPVEQDPPPLRWDRGSIRYIPRYGDQFIIDVGGTFEGYLSKFSKKSRGNLKREARRFVDRVSGAIDLRIFQSPADMAQFHEIALDISRRSYKRNRQEMLFSASAEYSAELADDAQGERVRGYILYIKDTPVAYAFCRLYGNIITYQHIAYDENFSRNSPGKVLLYLLIESLHNEHRFRVLDLVGTEYYSYKEFFATRTVKCVRVMWFRPSVRLFTLVILHWILTSAWRLGSSLLNCGKRIKKYFHENHSRHSKTKERPLQQQ